MLTRYAHTNTRTVYDLDMPVKMAASKVWVCRQAVVGVLLHVVHMLEFHSKGDLRFGTVQYRTSRPFSLPPKSGLWCYYSYDYLRYECGRVFPAGVGPDSPSRDDTNWLSTRFSRSVETRRRFDWLRAASARRATSELQFGALREEVALSRKTW